MDSPQTIHWQDSPGKGQEEVVWELKGTGCQPANDQIHLGMTKSTKEKMDLFNWPGDAFSRVRKYIAYCERRSQEQELENLMLTSKLEKAEEELRKIKSMSRWDKIKAFFKC